MYPEEGMEEEISKERKKIIKTKEKQKGIKILQMQSCDNVSFPAIVTSSTNATHALKSFRQ